jgi:hypothetical protein
MVNGELTKRRVDDPAGAPSQMLIVSSWRWRRYAVVFALAVVVAAFLGSGELLQIDSYSSGIVRTLSGIAGGIVLAVGWVLSLVLLGSLWRRPALRVVAQTITVYNWRRVRCALSDVGAVTWVEPNRRWVRPGGRVPALVLMDGTVVNLNFAATQSQAEAVGRPLVWHGDVSDPDTLMSRLSGRRRPSRSVPVRRLVAGLATMLVAGIWIAIWAGIAWTQSQDVSVLATVTAKSCHWVSGDDSSAGFTACVVTLSYTAPDGIPGQVVFHGVEASRLHEQNGQETVYIYFSSGSSETAISPQDEVPLWVDALMVAFGLPVFIASFVHLWRGFRPATTPDAARYAA